MFCGFFDCFLFFVFKLYATFANLTWNEINDPRECLKEEEILMKLFNMSVDSSNSIYIKPVSSSFRIYITDCISIFNLSTKPLY